MGLAHGIHGWVDVAVPDIDDGVSFYTGVFGWEVEDGDGGDAMPYTMFSLGGKRVAGMGTLGAQPAGGGRQAAWSAYVIVDDVDAIHARAIELGGTPLMEPMRIMDAGRMTFVVDPGGAAIGFWQSGSHDGAELFNVPNAVTWNDLATRDLERAKVFYTELLGWDTNVSEMDDGGTYWTITNAGRMNGGMWDMTGVLPDETPAHWMNWFCVEDCGATCATVRKLGGTVLREPTESSVGPIAVVADPFGAFFSIITPTRVDGQPPR